VEISVIYLKSVEWDRTQLWNTQQRDAGSDTLLGGLEILLGRGKSEV